MACQERQRPRRAYISGEGTERGRAGHGNFAMRARPAGSAAKKRMRHGRTVTARPCRPVRLSGSSCDVICCYPDLIPGHCAPFRSWSAAGPESMSTTVISRSAKQRDKGPAGVKANFGEPSEVALSCRIVRSGI
jgi:hypothetical protein